MVGCSKYLVTGAREAGTEEENSEGNMLRRMTVFKNMYLYIYSCIVLLVKVGLERHAVTSQLSIL